MPSRPRPAGRQARPPRPSTPASCVTAECHANIKAIRGRPWPGRHQRLRRLPRADQHAEKHTFSISAQKAELCTYCHEFYVAGMPVVHKPVTEGECLGCHDPHGGRDQGHRCAKTPRAELCGRCHENVTRGKTFLHWPGRAGRVRLVPPPHASQLPQAARRRRLGHVPGLPQGIRAGHRRRQVHAQGAG